MRYMIKLIQFTFKEEKKKKDCDYRRTRDFLHKAGKVASKMGDPVSSGARTAKLESMFKLEKLACQVATWDRQYSV